MFRKAVALSHSANRWFQIKRGKNKSEVSLSQNCPVTELFKGPHKQLLIVLNLEGPLSARLGFHSSYTWMETGIPVR